MAHVCICDLWPVVRVLISNVYIRSRLHHASCELSACCFCEHGKSELHGDLRVLAYNLVQGVSTCNLAEFYLWLQKQVKLFVYFWNQQ